MNIFCCDDGKEWDTKCSRSDWRERPWPRCGRWVVLMVKVWRMGCSVVAGVVDGGTIIITINRRGEERRGG